MMLTNDEKGRLAKITGECVICGTSGSLRVNFYDKDGSYSICRLCGIEFSKALGSGVMPLIVKSAVVLRKLGHRLHLYTPQSITEEAQC